MQSADILPLLSSVFFTKITWKCTYSSTTASFQILRRSSSTKHALIRRYTVWPPDRAVKRHIKWMCENIIFTAICFVS